jgi:quercetin dioxygenase-like cupin family protein
MLRLIPVLTGLVGLVLSCVACAQQSAPAVPTAPIKRTMLQKFDVPRSNYETVTAVAEIIPDVNAGRHTHPAVETGYVLEGEITLLVDGKSPVTFKPGDSYQVAPMVVHDGR